MTLGKLVRESLIRGTIFDPKIEPFLDADSRAILKTASEEDTFRLSRGQQASVLVSLSPHALHYLDLRIVLIMRNMHRAGVQLRLVLRDHQASTHPDQRLAMPEAKSRLLDVLDLFGVPVGDIQIVQWTDLANRLTLDQDLYRFFTAIDGPTLASAVRQRTTRSTTFTEILTTLTDVYVAAQQRYHPSSWLLGGPLRYGIQVAGIDAYRAAFGQAPVNTIPLPTLPFLPSLPGLVLEPEPQKAGSILSDCLSLNREELVLMHYAFFDLLEESIEQKITARKALRAPVEKLDLPELRSVTAQALEESLHLLRRRASRRHPQEVLEVPSSRVPDSLKALGDPRRVRMMSVLQRHDSGLTSNEILEELRLSESMITTVRRDLAALKAAGLVLTSGIKPIRYRAAAKRIQIHMVSDDG